jgi:UDP-glucose 4-epimerase
MRVVIFRFANIVGPKVRKTGRTVIGDFVDRLRENPARLRILGDGRQAKSYLTNRECVEAMLFAQARAEGPCSVFNLGGDDSVTVNRIADLVVAAMKLEGVVYDYTGGEGGWPGDVPRFTLDPARVNGLGWRAKLNSEQSVAEAIRATLEQGA